MGHKISDLYRNFATYSSVFRVTLMKPMVVVADYAPWSVDRSGYRFPSSVSSNAEDYTMVLVQIPMCKERESLDHTLKKTDMNPSITLRNTIEEWNARNETVQLDMARKSLTLGCPEIDTLRALRFSSSRRVRCKTLETVRVVVEDHDDNKEIMAEGDNVVSTFTLLLPLVSILTLNKD
ncbi:hypothetical protein M8C21_029313 [Ambrosia artemisiifolia]|uniref:Uncharacterized protein n=1 Tax=Ambrosia artemisiifolia TaxID=4212 RepID=A0AAD5CG88_AMBAR|nr:hypothetical protein M8C21_029313 [Ambrosia artemisiifolia]